MQPEGYAIAAPSRWNRPRPGLDRGWDANLFEVWMQLPKNCATLSEQRTWSIQFFPTYTEFDGNRWTIWIFFARVVCRWVLGQNLARGCFLNEDVSRSIQFFFVMTIAADIYNCHIVGGLCSSHRSNLWTWYECSTVLHVACRWGIFLKKLGFFREDYIFHSHQSERHIWRVTLTVLHVRSIVSVI